MPSKFVKKHLPTSLIILINVLSIMFIIISLM